DVAPGGLVRPVGFPRRVGVPPLRIDRRDDLVHRRVGAAGAAHAVVEDQDVAGAGGGLGDPVGVVLAGELLVLVAAGAVGPRVAPAVEQVAALAVAAALVAGRLGGGGAVVEDPDLAELVDAEHDLVQLGVVGHGVDVGPVRLDARPLLAGGGADVADG